MPLKSKRSWLRPQFTLGALLVLITVCTPFLAYVREIRRMNERKMAAFEASLLKGASFTTTRGNPPTTTPGPNAEEFTARAWWKAIVRQPNLPDYSRLKLTDIQSRISGRPPITDKDLESLQYLAEIEEFNFYYSRHVTDEGLKVLSMLPKLKKIQLQDLEGVRGDFLDHFPEDNQVETLWLMELKNLDGAKLAGLKKLKNLKMLWICNCSGLTDQSLREVGLPASVQEVHVRRNGLADETLTRWLSQVTLKRLDVEEPISRESIPALAKQTALNQLYMTNAPLIDEDFAFLKNCTSLTGLKLNGMPLRGGVLDFVAHPEKVGLLELNSTLMSDENLPKLARFEKLSVLGLAWTPLTGEGFGADVKWPTPWDISLCGTRFSEVGKEAFAKLNGLKMVALPSNWTLEDLQLFPADSRPKDPSLNAFVLRRRGTEVNNPVIQGYMPYLKMDKIDNCPANLMKPVVALQAIGTEEFKAVESP